MLFARTSKALTRLNEAMRERKLRKTYLAKVEGVVEEEGCLQHLLIHGDFKAFVDPKGKQAILRYRRLQATVHHSLVEIELETGATIRLGLSLQRLAIRLSVIGSMEVPDLPQIALHHHQLILEHPTTKELLTFQCSAAFSSL